MEEHKNNVNSKKINAVKANKTGLNPEKKKILEKLMGTASFPLDLNKMRDEIKYGKSKNQKKKENWYGRFQSKRPKGTKKEIGVVETLRYIEQFDNNESGNYTVEKYQTDEPELTDAEIRKMFDV